VTHSIRFKLTILSILSIAVVVSGSFLAVFALIRNHMLEEFDRSLVDRAYALAALVEWDEKGISFVDSDRATFSETHEAREEFFRLFIADTKLRIDSPAILDIPFPQKPKSDAGVYVEDWQGPSGHPSLRLVHLPFSLEEETEEDEHEATAAAFGAGRRDLHLILGWDVSVVQERLAYIRWVLILAVGLVLTVTTAMLWSLIRRQLSPLVLLGRQLADISERQLDQRFDVDGAPGEIVPVLTHLNQMMKTLEAAFEREKAFASNAAHEMRTPLAGLRMTLEVALSQERDAAEYREAIDQSLDICNQMHPMVENLLAISRMEAGKLRLDPESLSLSTILTDAWRPFEKRAEVASLQVDCQWDRECRIVADRAMLMMVVNNLFDNAISYTPVGGHLKITVESSESCVTLTVSNSTDAVTTEDLDHLFEPFWRHDQARRQAGLHAGLGLSICRKILELLHGQIQITLEDGSRFVVTVLLPMDA
jgi:heavy metal sensor kinase